MVTLFFYEKDRVMRDRFEMYGICMEGGAARSAATVARGEEKWSSQVYVIVMLDLNASMYRIVLPYMSLSILYCSSTSETRSDPVLVLYERT